MITTSKALEAAEVLSVELEGLTEAVMVAGYRAVAKECHPDTGNHDPERWSRATWAKKTLTEWLAAAPVTVVADTGPRCRACRGKGYTQSQSGLRMRCVLCDGEGTL